MKIVRIFDPCLYAFKFDNKSDELIRLIDFWTNQKELREYFENNGEVLDYYHIDIEEAILQTIESANVLIELLLTYKTKLDYLFESLSNSLYQESLLPKQKYKRKWIRLYAIKIESNYYIITGGAIKQSMKMKAHPDTNDELKKLDSCRSYFIEHGVIDADSFNDFLYELEV
jgi:hypothetical protein